MSSVVKTYLEFMASVQETNNKNKGLLWTSYEKLVLELGQSFEPKVEAIAPRGRRKFCFENAIRFCLESQEEFFYCEGYAFTDRAPIPVLHAWVYHPDGWSFDPTWDDGTEYFGIKITQSYALSSMIETGYYGLLGNDWCNDNRILKEGFPANVIKGGENVGN